tara:strand:+ start:388 stop:594 length:207 start_codon:yes stop_codon:yes gene_type:complete
VSKEYEPKWEDKHPILGCFGVAIIAISISVTFAFGLEWFFGTIAGPPSTGGGGGGYDNEHRDNNRWAE